MTCRDLPYYEDTYQGQSKPWIQTSQNKHKNHTKTLYIPFENGP